MEIKPLDALQIAAMRKADVMCFHHRERQSYIRAVKRNAKTERNPFAEDEYNDSSTPESWVVLQAARTENSHPRALAQCRK